MRTKYCRKCKRDLEVTREHFYLYADGTPRTPCRECRKAYYQAKRAPQAPAPRRNGRVQVRRPHAREAQS
jgi:hypothetical protein